MSKFDHKNNLGMGIKRNMASGEEASPQPLSQGRGTRFYHQLISKERQDMSEIKKRLQQAASLVISRVDKIRTCDPTPPRRVRYRAAPLPAEVQI